ncbi:hypothetical protein PVAP13_4KG066633 [Panicum virgatum]|uniref:Uncharacterized protein n=1 Tax=Panicum virgatum TaxID=38727 RepID=A0A8T0TL28_PANVG|nr:hypothetical protein PVAP13_4KG066633 [Panicum virgatum]
MMAYSCDRLLTFQAFMPLLSMTVFTHVSCEHLGKQHREVFYWLLLRSFMMKNRR